MPRTFFVFSPRFQLPTIFNISLWHVALMPSHSLSLAMKALLLIPSYSISRYLLDFATLETAVPFPTFLAIVPPSTQRVASKDPV